MSGARREPAEESTDLYPGLVVADDRVTGSITFGRSRIPVWAIIGEYATHGWDGVRDGWPPVDELGWDGDRFAAFLYDLMELRGEFGRLLLVLADAERCERTARRYVGWWTTRRHRKRVADQLRRCLAALDSEGDA